MVMIMETNQYTGIAEYYDLMMCSGYFDYEKMAKAADAILGDRNRVIEIGVGTGLMPENLLALSARTITGVDFTPSMLDIARRRLGNRVRLLEADVTEMSLGETFDAAISCGGVWHIVQIGEAEYAMSSHIPGYGANLRGLENLAAHVRTGGLLLLSVQGPHSNYEKPLPGGVVYSQEVVLGDGADTYIMEKQYFFRKAGKVVAHEHVSFTFFRNQAQHTLMSDAGFHFEAIDPSKQFWIYSRA